MQLARHQEENSPRRAPTHRKTWKLENLDTPETASHTTERSETPKHTPDIREKTSLHHSGWRRGNIIINNSWNRLKWLYGRWKCSLIRRGTRAEARESEEDKDSEEVKAMHVRVVVPREVGLIWGRKVGWKCMFGHTTAADVCANRLVWYWTAELGRSQHRRRLASLQ